MPQQQINKKLYKKPRYSKRYGGQAGFSIRTPMGLALSANAKASYALSQLNTELKYVDVAQLAVTSATTGYLLNPLAQGSSASQRVGNTVRFKSLDIRAAITPNDAQPSWLRVIVLRDDQANGTVPTITDVLESNSITSFRNLDNVKRFKILSDQTYSMRAKDLANGVQAEPSFIKFHVDLGAKNKAVKKQKGESEYGLGNTGGIADISTGAYWIMFCQSSVTLNPLFSFTSRMRYVDN